MELENLPIAANSLILVLTGNDKQVSESEAGSLIYALNRNTKVAIHSVVDQNTIFNTKEPSNSPIH